MTEKSFMIEKVFILPEERKVLLFPTGGQKKKRSLRRENVARVMNFKSGYLGLNPAFGTK